jgi:hypothetical protein
MGVDFVSETKEGVRTFRLSDGLKEWEGIGMCEGMMHVRDGEDGVG